MGTIYIKTAAGQRELQTRERRLAPRMRSLLILIDGKRTHEELAALVQQLDTNLPTLLDAGLVEIVAAASPDSASAMAPASLAVGPQAIENPDALRRAAVRAVNDLLGPMGEALALRLERASSGQELDAALERAVAYIANARGGAAAAQFANRFIRTAPG